MKEVKITTEYITLGQLLKYLGIISNGSGAKIIVKVLRILVNNELEDRRGRKLYPDDTIKIENNTYIIKK